MRWSSILFLFGLLFNTGGTSALTTYYATQGFTPPGGCASSTAGALNVIVSLPVPDGADGLQVKEVAYALRGTTTQPGTMTITASGVTASANPANAYTCCSASYCDLATYTIGLGSSWYESPCGNPQCGTAQQWYRLPFSTGWYATNGANSLGVNIEFGGAGVSLANFGSGSSFFVSYYARFPSPSPTVTPTRTSTITSTPTRSITSSSTTTPTQTSSVTSSVTASITNSLTPTSSSTTSSSHTPTNTPSSTSSSSITPTRTASASASFSITPTNTQSSSSSQSPSYSTSWTPTMTISPSPSNTPTASISASSSFTPSQTVSQSVTASASISSSITSSPSPSISRTIISRPIPSSMNSTDTSIASNGDSALSVILSGTTVGITGLAALTYLINYLRKSGALNLLNSMGIRVPGVTTTTSTTVKTEEEIKLEQEAANSPLGKMASMIEKAKGEQKEILKVIDKLPISDQLKYTAHNPKSLLSKSTQAKIDTVQRDLEKGLSSVDKIEKQARASRTPSPTATPKLDDESLKILRQYADILGNQLQERIASREKSLSIVEPEEDEEQEDIIGQTEEEQVEATEEVEVEEEEVKKTFEPVANPVIIPTPTVIPVRKSRVKKVTQLSEQARKANIEVDEKDLAEIKLILATKKKQYNVI